MEINAPPVVLIIRDGWGHVPAHCDDAPEKYNAILQAHTPVADKLFEDSPTTMISTSGSKVGLPNETMGNSEVGHQNIGAGRIVPQELMRLNDAVERGEFKTNPVIQKSVSHVANGNTLHIVGLLSNGCIHSDIAHLFALLDAIPQETRIRIHVITDGRDTSPVSGLGFVESLEEAIAGRNAQIATVMGRYYAMDRDYRWQRVAIAYDAMTGRVSTHPLRSKLPSVGQAKKAIDVLLDYYESPSEPSRKGDEFVVPTHIVDDQGEPIGLVHDGDSIVFFNYRGDRPRELTRAFVLDETAWEDEPREPFDRGEPFKDVYFVSMTNYESGLPVSGIAFDKPSPMKEIFGEVLSQNKIKQCRCAETEKFPHVTFFFNDYREEPFEGETRALIQSPTDVTTYDQKPEMSAYEVCQAVIDELQKEDGARVIIVNFANGDMVGHTGNFEAIVKAIEIVDECCGKIIEEVLKQDGSLIITADHGNAERTWNIHTDSPDTAHTTYDVPLHVVGDDYRSATLRNNGVLADIAPTLLAMLDIPCPKSMTGTSLINA